MERPNTLGGGSVVESVDLPHDLPDDLPKDLPIVLRSSVRLVVLDARGHVLLFHTREVARPDQGTWWELPGGGIDPGETYLDTAVRELREETGLTVGPERVDQPTWRRRASFQHGQERYVQDEVVATVRLDRTAPAIDTSSQLDHELESYFGYRWWPVNDVVAGTASFYPRRLPQLLTDFLAGKTIDEPFELWI